MKTNSHKMQIQLHIRFGNIGMLMRAKKIHRTRITVLMPGTTATDRNCALNGENILCTPFIEKLICIRTVDNLHVDCYTLTYTDHSIQ